MSQQTDTQKEDSFDGITYCFKNLNVFAPEKKVLFRKPIPEKQILHNISGLCKPGQFLAVMGSSGAGKTTLLNVLTYRSLNLKIKGDIYLNGQINEMKRLMGVSAYVQQEDLFCKVFTVREQIEFSAQLRIGKKVSESYRKKKIEEIIHELGLSKCQNTMIGDPGRIKGISGGEKKRLAFACELITDPMILFCDEPTSGLDSFMAQGVVRIMKNLTEKGKTVISTIHQPSSEVFAMFDQILLLAEGRVAFHGSIDRALLFFDRIGCPCPDDFNPSDHYIYKLAIQGGRDILCQEFVKYVCDSYRDNEFDEKIKEIEDSMDPRNYSGDISSKIHQDDSPYKATYYNQFAAVLRRSFYEVVRNRDVLFIKLAQSMFFALIFGLIYFNQDPTDPKEIINISAAIFVFITNLTFANLFPVVTNFANEMPLLLREHWNGMYRTDVYFMTRSIVELPIYLFIPIAYTSISYFMVGFRDGAGHFFIAVIIYTLIVNTAVSYGYMISCISADFQTALTLSTPLTFPLILFSGFYLSEGSYPVYLSWIQYISWFSYGFEALMINQWKDFKVSNETLGFEDVGNAVLDNFGFEHDDLAKDIGALIGLVIVFRIFALLALMIKARNKNKK